MHATHDCLPPHSSSLPRRHFILGLAASGLALTFAAPVFADETLIKQLESNYKGWLARGDGHQAQIARFLLAVQLATHNFGYGLARRQRAYALLEEAILPKNAKYDPVLTANAKLILCSMMLEEDRDVTARKLPTIRTRLKDCEKVFKKNNAAVQIAIYGLQTELLGGNIPAARRYLEMGLANMKGIQLNADGEKMDADSFMRELVIEFYSCAALLAYIQGKAPEALRWTEAANMMSEAALNQVPISQVPDTSGSIEQTATLAKSAPVVHMFVSRAGSGMIFTKNTSAGVSHNLHRIMYGKSRTYDGKDAEEELWGDLLWRAMANNRYSGWHGAYSAVNPKTFIESVPIMGRNIWGTWAGSLFAMLRSEGLAAKSAYMLIMPTDLAAIPLIIANDGTGHPFVREYLTAFHGVTSQALLQAQANTQRLKGKTPTFIGLFNPYGDLTAADAEKAMVALPYSSGKVLVADAGTPATAYFNTMAAEPNCYLYLATHGSYNSKSGSGVYLGGRQQLTTDMVQSYGKSLNSRLAIFSACETAMVNMTMTSRPTTLPSALIARGVGGVIGSHWSVNDYSTALLMSAVMRLIRKNDLQPANALVIAQHWVSSANAEQIIAFLQSAIDELASAEKSQPIRKLMAYFTRMSGKEVPFSNPFYWGGMVYYGS